MIITSLPRAKPGGIATPRLFKRARSTQHAHSFVLKARNIKIIDKEKIKSFEHLQEDFKEVCSFIKINFGGLEEIYFLIPLIYSS